MAIYASDILDPNKDQRNQTLFKNFGMDPNGNNEIGAWLRRLAQGSGYQAAQGIGFQNQLEPQRQGAISALVNSANPSNMVAQAQASGQGLVNQGSQYGQQSANNLAHLGLGAGAQAGAMQQSANQGQMGANNLLYQANSPQAQQMALQSLLAAISQAPGAGLNQLLQMFGPIETRQQANYAQHQNGGLAGIGGILGSVLPGIGGLGSIFGHGGQQTFNPVTMSDYGIPGDQVGPYGFIPRAA